MTEEDPCDVAAMKLDLVAAYARSLGSGPAATWPWRHEVRATLNEILFGKG